MSRLTCTSVMLTIPRRGSSISSRISAESSRCMASATRSLRVNSLGMAATCTRRYGADAPSQLACNLLHIIDLNLVTSADVVVVLHADTTLGPTAYFVDIILEAAQGFQDALVDHHIVAQ